MPSHVQIWTCKIPDKISSKEEQELLQILGSSEQARYKTLHHEERQIQYLYSHSHLRQQLADHLHLDPKDVPLVFPSNSPPILETNDREVIYLSLSHTHGMVACAMAHAPIGIDIENWKARGSQLESRGALLKIAERFFSEKETTDLQSLNGDARSKRFFELWTLKEAKLKSQSADGTYEHRDLGDGYLLCVYSNNKPNS